MILWDGRRCGLNSPLHRFIMIYGSSYWSIYGPSSERMCSPLRAQPTPHDWVGSYINQEGIMPKWVVCVGYFKKFRFGPLQFFREIMATFSKIHSRNTNFYYYYWGETECEECWTPHNFFSAMISQVKVNIISQSNTQTQFTSSLVNWTNVS
jgi:hypothetical protein